jgi:hypothetical protein
MEKKDCMQKQIHHTFRDEPSMNIADRSVIRKSAGSLRKMFFIASLAGAGLLFAGCVGYGYVDTEPAYGVSYRSPQPSSTHIWIDGGWGWNNQSHGYVQRAGYWDRPRQNQTYVTGTWQSSPKGKYWQNGHWQKNNNGNGKNSHKGNGNNH